ncbi:MAG: hypothetical protein JNM75_02710, partial [Rhodospirillales bacterium]|nr:hypothetical protein [Rhodospirillales bacterium]
MNARAIAGWVRDRLIDLLPGWLGRRVHRLPDRLSLIIAPLVALVLIGLGLQWAFDIVDGLRQGVDVIVGRSHDPATEEGQAALQRQLDELKAEQKAQAEAILAELRKGQGAPLDAEAEAARKGAVSGLVAEDSKPAREAARDLAAGDLPEAFAALEHQARAAEAEAAEKWRRLGALATGVDTTRALAAYEQAYRLEPTDFSTCVFLARLRAEAGDLRGAHDAARAAAAAASTERERAAADSELGNVLVQGGDLAGARTAYEESLALARRLAADNPGSAEARRDVSVSLSKLGNVLVAGGHLAGAKAAYEEVLALALRLAADSPGSAAARRDVAGSLEKLGDVLVESGVLAGAKDAYEESLALARRLAADNPGSAEARRDVSV